MILNKLSPVLISRLIVELLISGNVVEILLLSMVFLTLSSVLTIVIGVFFVGFDGLDGTLRFGIVLFGVECFGFGGLFYFGNSLGDSFGRLLGVITTGGFSSLGISFGVSGLFGMQFIKSYVVCELTHNLKFMGFKKWGFRFIRINNKHKYCVTFIYSSANYYGPFQP